jgi:uncharacterized membrane protein YhdT
MSRLQKAAWFNLAMGAGSALTAGLCFALLARLNAKGMDDVLIFFIVACVLTPILYILYRKKSFEAGFDERENMIYRRAFTLSAWVLMVFLAGICIVPFFVLGGQSVIRVYYLPLVFVSTLFTAQFAHSVAILVQCELEEDDGQ